MKMAEWKPIKEALSNPKVTGQQETLFVARFGIEAFPSFNAVYYDPLQVSEHHPWCFADGGGSYHKDWPTHWMFAEEAANFPGNTMSI